MNRAVLFLAALAAATGAAPPSRDLELAPSDHAAPGRARDRIERALIELTAQGDLRIHDAKPVTRNGELELEFKLRGCTLEALGRSLARAIRIHEAVLRERGETVRAQFRNGTDAARIRLVIAVDHRAPWRHVQWLLVVAAAEQVYKTEFAVRRAGAPFGILRAWLPFDATAEDAVDAVRNRLRVDLGVRKDGKTAFRLEGKVLPDARTLRERLAAARQQRRHTWVHINPTAATPAGEVLRVVDLCHGLDIKRIDFAGAPRPDRKTWTARRLPPIEKNKK